MEKLKPEIPEEYERLDFYNSCLEALKGVEVISERYAVLAERLAVEQKDQKRKQELERISQICKNVPKNPAKSFWEAVQSVHFLTFCMSARSGLYQFGRPDRYLIDFYRNDIENKRITKEFAQELIDCLGIMINEYTASGLAAGLMVGGSDSEGKDVTNELTYMFIESIRNVRMIYPGIGLCYTKDTPDDLLDLSLSIIGEGHTHPALFNDQTIIKGLRYYGLPAEEACLYTHSTCVEITPANSSAVWVASPYTNLIQLLLDNLIEENVEEDSFEKLSERFYNALSTHIKNNAIMENRAMMERTLHSRNPLVSCFVNDCLESGQDIENRGARYNWIMPSFVGVANVADAFCAIKKLVFDENVFTMQKLKAMLETDFEGCEKERLIIKNRAPKYGNDDGEVDIYVEQLTEFLIKECEKYKTYRGGRFIPSLFCWVMHEKFGTETGASPDGRKKGFPLGDGSGPAQGNEKNGPTASILSSTKWNHFPFIGGIAVNMKFMKKEFGSGSINKMKALVKTFMERGGFELQINAVDTKTLIEAQKMPEKYSDLVVRVGGYSDYFVRLSPAMQSEVIARTGHEI